MFRRRRLGKHRGHRRLAAATQYNRKAGGFADAAPTFLLPWPYPGLLNEAALSLGESEYDHRRGARAPEEAGDDTGRCRDILLSVERVGDHTAANRAARVEPVERLSLARVDRATVV